MVKIDDFKKLINNTLLYGVGIILGKIIDYLIVPLHTSRLTPTSYGIMTEFYIYIAFGVIFSPFGMELAYFRFANQEKERLIFNSSMSILLIFSTLFSSIFVFFISTFIPWCQTNNHYVYYLVSIVVTDVLCILPFARLRFYKKSLLFCGMKIFKIILNVLLNFLLLYDRDYFITNATWIKFVISSDIECVFFSHLISNIIIIIPIFLLSSTLSQFRFTFDWYQMKPILRYAFPLVVTSVPLMINEMISRLILRRLLPSDFYPYHDTSSVVGIFSACYKISLLLAFLLKAFQQAAEPFFFAHFKCKNSKILFSQVMHLFIMSSCFILLVLTLNLTTIGNIFLRNAIYREGIEIVPYLALSYLLSGVYYNLSIWFKIVNKVYYGACITTCGVFTTIIFNIFLVPLMGYWGCVWATLSSCIVQLVLCYFLGKKYYSIPYNLQGIWYILATLCLVKIIRTIYYPFSIISVGITLFLTLLITIVFYFLCRRWWLHHVTLQENTN